MAAGTRKPRFTLPQSGPEARRAREAALDAAARSKAIRAPAPAPAADERLQMAAVGPGGGSIAGQVSEG